MADEKTNLFRNILGLNAPTANWIGGGLTATGLIGALLSPTKNYYQATKKIQEDISGIPGQNALKMSQIEAGFNADLAANAQKAQEQAESGLGARGITDAGVRAETRQNTARGISGAYAAARSALGKAKLNAQMGLQGAMGNYYGALAQKQLESTLANQMAKAGIWGALGGAGVGLAGLGSPAKEDKQIFSESPKLNLFQIGGK